MYRVYIGIYDKNHACVKECLAKEVTNLDFLINWNLVNDYVGALITRVVLMYHQTSNTRHTVVGNKIVNHSDVIGASTVGAAASSFMTEHLASMDWAKTTAKQYEKHLSFGFWCALYERFDGIYIKKIICQFKFFLVSL